MAIKHSQPNELIDICPYAGQLDKQVTHSVFKSKQIEVLRLIMPMGKVIAEHKAPGEITVQCLEGRIAFTADGKTQELVTGNLLYLTAGVPHSLKSIESASVLVTIVIAKE